MGLYVPLDVNFPSDDKILAAGPAAAYLYVCSLAFSKRNGSDGLIRTAQLPALGVPKPAALAGALVSVGLWLVVDEGWQIAAWLKHNKSKAELDAKAEQKRLAAVKANHERWHDKKPSDDCPLCVRTASEPDREPNPREEKGSDDEVIGSEETLALVPSSTSDAPPVQPRSERVKSAIGLLADYDVAHTHQPRNPRALRERCYAARERDHASDLHSLAYEHEDWTAQQLRDAVLDVPRASNLCELCEKPKGAAHNDWTCTVGQRAKAGTA